MHLASDAVENGLPEVRLAQVVAGVGPVDDRLRTAPRAVHRGERRRSILEEWDGRAANPPLPRCREGPERAHHRI